MSQEALQLSRTAETCHKTGATILAIASGKGGVGKTHLAANLGICMASSGKKVLLLDGDLSLGNLDIILDLNNKYNISHLISGRKNIDEIIGIGPEGVEVICGTSGFENMANLSEFERLRLIQQLGKLQENNDVIIIDTAAGISKQVVGFCLASDNVLIVSTPEATSMTDAYAMIKVLVGNGFEQRISLLVNMAENYVEGKKTYQQIANVARRFLNCNVYNSGVLLRDERVISAAKMRKPVVTAFPKADITCTIEAIAARLSNSELKKYNGDGFFEKVVNWFF